MLFFVIVLNLLLNCPLIISFYIYPLTKPYCRDSERLIVSDKLDEYLLVDVELNTTVLLNCHFCEEFSDHQPRLWYFQGRFQETGEHEVEFDMNNNISNNRINLNADFDLIVKDFGLQDAGIYRCHGELGQDIEKKYNYRLEHPDAEFIQKGNLSDWEIYRRINLIPVTERFAVSRMPSLALIRNSDVTLETISEWSVWSPCGKCIDKRGLKTSRAQCRLRAYIGDKASNTSEIVKFFDKSPLLPCRSYLLDNQFPIVSRILRRLPEFLLEKKCKKCKRLKPSKNKDKFKYKKRFTLAEGAHLAIVCPEADMDSIIVWKRDDKKLNTGSRTFFKKKKDMKESRVLVDAFSTLYFVEVTKEEEGNYTCYVNDIKMMLVKIRVASKSRLLTAALLRHMKYLGFILLLSSFCYCAGLIAICKNPKKYSKKTYEMILEERNKRKGVKFQADSDNEEEGID